MVASLRDMKNYASAGSQADPWRVLEWIYRVTDDAQVIQVLAILLTNWRRDRDADQRAAAIRAAREATPDQGRRYVDRKRSES